MYVTTNLLKLSEFGWAGASNVIAYKEALQRYDKAAAAEASAKLAKDAAGLTDDERKRVEGNYENAVQELAAARDVLVDGSLEGMQKLLEDMASKAKDMTKSGLENIVQQIWADDYAQFIRRLMALRP